MSDNQVDCRYQKQSACFRVCTFEFSMTACAMIQKDSSWYVLVMNHGFKELNYAKMCTVCAFLRLFCIHLNMMTETFGKSTIFVEI